MKAAAFTEPGPPEVLRLTELPDPQAGPGEVRVRVKAAGVQPYDAAVRGGWEPPGLKLGWPRVPGNEFAGVVDQLGDGVTGVRKGTEVLGFTAVQAYAEYVVVPAENITPKPANMPWEVAGGFSAGAQTAHIALGELGIGEGDTLLVHAAAGSVGTIAVQLAKLRGATVIGTASEANQDYLRELGAIPIVYGDGLLDRVLAAAPGGVHAALDGAGGAALEVSLELVKDRQRILTLFEHDKAAGLGIKVIPAGRTAARLAELAQLHAEGKLRFHVRRTLPLEQAAEAHREIETGHGRGKIVLSVF
ncbi:NADP-dependent oxidoreductase [Amycolatopsis nigrescens]|uniref:NADP-dependent oxidoreductase n=1 Tax=Amycolatopsis nigrescens TaxID=381445 RepID=UPI00036B3B25|nr:NADP-dependent oxidoreductase [Amycolatopsis nigrescens]